MLQDESTLGKWLSTVAGLPNGGQYASQMEEPGYETPETILAARTAEVLSRDCNLRIGTARRMLEAAEGNVGGGPSTQPQHSLAVCT